MSSMLQSEGKKICIFIIYCQIVILTSESDILRSQIWLGTCWYWMQKRDVKQVPAQPGPARSVGALIEERLAMSAVILQKGFIFGDWSSTVVIYGWRSWMEEEEEVNVFRTLNLLKMEGWILELYCWEDLESVDLNRRKRTLSVPLLAPAFKLKMTLTVNKD